MSAASQGLSGKAAIVGVANTEQGLLPGRSPYELALEALKLAIDDAAIPKQQIDGLLTAGVGSVEMAKLAGLEPRVTGGLEYRAGGFVTQYAAMLIASGACETVARVFAHTPATSLDQLSGHIVYDQSKAW
jgi:acetyl-CoA acetyltransferase